jgi:signal transduction histidine kinase
MAYPILRNELSMSRSKASTGSPMGAALTLLNGTAHDLNNILSTIVGYCELAQEQAPAGSTLCRYLGNIEAATDRARALADRLLGPAHSKFAERAPVPVQRVVSEVLELIRACLPESIRLEAEFLAPDATIIADELQLHRMTMNLCKNAADAMPNGGFLSVRLEQLRVYAARTCSRRRLTPGSYLSLTVGDSGAGIDPDFLHRIFDPFFTTKPVGEGTGLGLALVDRTVADIGGAIDVWRKAEPEAGTDSQIWLPISKPRESSKLETVNQDTTLSASLRASSWARMSGLFSLVVGNGGTINSNRPATTPAPKLLAF